MIKKYDAILLTAGKGERFGLPLNKIFYLIKNKAVFEYSLEVFLSDKRCGKIVIVYNEDDLNILNNFLAKYDQSKIILCQGGSLRQESVMNGLEMCGSEYVLVHDAARPNIGIDLIDNVLLGLTTSDSVSLGVKVTDTIKKVTDTIETVERDNLYYVQTPQGSKREVLISALQKSKDVVVTDDLSAIEKFTNVKPMIVEGRKNNIKVTTLEDVEILEFYLEKNNV